MCGTYTSTSLSFIVAKCSILNDARKTFLVIMVQWNVHKTDTIGEQPFGRHKKVVILVRFRLPELCMLNESFLAANESWRFANCFFSSYKLDRSYLNKL